MQLLGYSAKTDKGSFLSINEDDFVVDLERKLYGVIDGMGGGTIGKNVTVSLKENILKYFYKFSEENSTMPLYYSARFLIEGNALINAIYQCNNMIYEENLQKTEKGAASLAFINQTESLLTVVSVGNVQGYLFRNKELNYLNLIDSFKFNSSIPTNLLGIYEVITPQIKEIQLQKGDLVILLSQGIYPFIKEIEMINILQQELPLSSKLDNFISTATSNNSKNNQTALFLQF